VRERFEDRLQFWQIETAVQRREERCIEAREERERQVLKVGRRGLRYLRRLSASTTRRHMRGKSLLRHRLFANSVRYESVKCRK
jgi:hypothetical protein